MSKEIKAFKLISGEEVLGKVIGEGSDHVVLEDALALHAQPGPQGMQIGLIPFMMSNTTAREIQFERSAIVCSTEPSKELQDGYLQQTSSIDLTTKLPT